jgi:hypothetical protein
VHRPTVAGLPRRARHWQTAVADVARRMTSRARACSRCKKQFRIASFHRDLLKNFQLKCTKVLIKNLLISLPSTTSTKAHRGFEQHVLHKLLTKLRLFIAPVKSNYWHWPRFFTHFHLEFEMPLNMKVVSHEKLHNFCIGRI